MKSIKPNRINVIIATFFSIVILVGVFSILMSLPIENFSEEFAAYKHVLIPLFAIMISLLFLLCVIGNYARKLKHAGNKFEFAAEYDLLTGLRNRNSFKSKLSDTIEKYKNREISNFTIFFIDLDNFKTINDFNSHKVGDFVLITVAERLKSLSISEESNCTIARYSGDKFMMLLTNTKSNEIPASILYIRQLLSTPIQIPIESPNPKHSLRQKSIILRTSIGIVESSKVNEESTTDEYLSAVDIATNTAKRLGKNKYVFFEPTMREKIQKNVNTARIIESACQKDGFTVAYQPQINAKDGTIYGYEALIRMSYAKMGPGQFIPVAEEDGHIAKIGRIVTEKVIRQIAIWRKHGLPLRKVSINYSAGQIEDKEYVNYLKNLMKSYNVPPELVGIEITESLFMGSKEQALEIFNEFSDIGLKVALDDFGTGYSSLSYLTYLPLEIVKIDKSLVDTYLKQEQEEDNNFIFNVVNLVHSLGMKITVEGVEHKWQFERLKKIGCDYIQGFFFSKPLTAEEIETFVPQKI